MGSDCKVVELSAEEAIASSSVTAPSSPQNLAREFFQWQATSASVDAVVIAAKKVGALGRLFGQKNGEHGTEVILGATALQRHWSLLQQAAISGFRLLAITNSNELELTAFFKDRGYKEAPTSCEQVLRAAWNVRELEDALSVASKIGWQNMCLFAHDADPVYVFTKHAG